MRIVVITGSLNQRGTSALRDELYCAGAEETGHDVYRFDAAFQNVNPCIGCDNCGYGSSRCIYRDGMDQLNPFLLHAEVVVFITPLYFLGMSAQIKAVIDRFYANDIRLHDGRKAMLMVTAWNPSRWAMNGVVAHYETLLHYMNWHDAGQLLAMSCNTRAEIERSNYPELAYEMGRSL